MNKNFSFCYEKFSNHRSRVGVIQTPHGPIETPNFIFCATKASLKSLTADQIRAANTQIILSNTYHLMLRPGPDIVEKLGGLHKMIGWNGPMFTDSGGFQIFSLGYGSVSLEIKNKRNPSKTVQKRALVKIREEGATFRSYVDGKLHILTPENSIQTQRALGADLIVVLDECTPYNVNKDYTARSMSMSHRWALRSLAEFKKHDSGRQALYGITQGGVYPHLRRISADFINEQDFFGHAVGGSLGATKDEMYEVVDMATEPLDSSRPIHLLGIGGVRDIFAGVKCGIDTFDCVHPTRLARHRGALARPGHNSSKQEYKEHINLHNTCYKLDDTPIEANCACYTCQNHSKGYLHYLLKAKELTVFSLITIHNMFFMNSLMHAIREGIRNNTLGQVEKEWII